MLIRKIKYTCIILSLVSVFNVSAYEIDSHSQMTELAITNSRLPSLILDFGFSNKDLYPNVHNNQLSSIDLIKFGSRFEDGCVESTGNPNDICKNTDLPNTSDVSVFHHFYDPQNAGAGLSLPFNCGTGVSSLDWATERNQQYILPIDYCAGETAPQEYSYEDALVYFRNALTSSQKNTRDINFGKLIQTFGHIIHHVQDMAQPDHVRNDQHCGADKCKSYGGIFYDPSTLERSVDRIFNECVKNEIEQSDIYLPYVWHGSDSNRNDSLISSPSDFWDSGDGRGMAEFTARNFVSPDTNFWGPIDDPNPVSAYPLPNPDFTNPLWKTDPVDVKDLSICGNKAISALINEEIPVLLNYNKLQGKIKFITKTISDPASGVTYPDVKISSYSIFTDDLQKKNLIDEIDIIQPIYSLNPFIYESYYKILLPRAVGYSAGLINYFFRGQFGRIVSPDEAKVYSNQSGATMIGEVKVYYDVGDIRKLHQSFNVSLDKYARTPPIDFTQITDVGFTGWSTIVFDGVIGGEKGLAIARHYVEPVVTEPTPTPTPGTPCGTTVDFKGRTGTHTRTMVLGSTAGPVEFEFEAYTIPDAYKIKLAGTNTVLNSSGGQISGYKKSTFNWNPGSNTSVDVEVTGNSDSGTEWWFTMGCPGQPLATPVDRVNVQFISESAGYTCSADLWVDNKYIAHLNSSNYSINYEMTKGNNHVYEYKNVSVGCGGGFGSYWNMKYRDNAGTHTINSPKYSFGQYGFTVN